MIEFVSKKNTSFKKLLRSVNFGATLRVSEKEAKSQTSDKMLRAYVL